MHYISNNLTVIYVLYIRFLKWLKLRRQLEAHHQTITDKTIRPHMTTCQILNQKKYKKQISQISDTAHENTFYEYDFEPSLNEISSSSPLSFGSDTLVSLNEVVLRLQEFIQVNLKDSQAGGIMIQDLIKKLIHSSSY